MLVVLFLTKFLVFPTYNMLVVGFYIYCDYIGPIGKVWGEYLKALEFK